jgi:hypothetical protein
MFIGTQFSILYTSMYSPAGAAFITYIHIICIYQAEMSPCSPQTPQHTDAPGSSAGNWCLSASCINLAATPSKQEGSTTELSSASLGARACSVPRSSTSKSGGWSASTCLSTKYCVYAAFVRQDIASLFVVQYIVRSIV